MLVLGLACSPRRGGNSEILLDLALAGARETGAFVEKIFIPSLKIIPCKSCAACEKDGKCVIDDDMQLLYKKFDAAGALVVSSPIYFYNVTAWAKAVIDRAQALWVSKYILKSRPDREHKKGAFIAVGGTRGSSLFEGSRLTVRYFFDALGYTYEKELLIPGVDEKGAIREHSEYLQSAYQLGAGLVGTSDV